MTDSKTDVEQVPVPLTDEQRAEEIRAQFRALCDVLDRMHEWTINYRLYQDDIGRWKSSVGFHKTVNI